MSSELLAMSNRFEREKGGFREGFQRAAGLAQGARYDMAVYEVTRTFPSTLC